jgi:hypothetical protein
LSDAPQQDSFEGIAHSTITVNEPPHMIARVSALAIKTVFPFIAKKDIRYYLNGANIRPLDAGGVMVVATDGHRYVIVRDPEGFAEQEIIVAVNKDGLKHIGSQKHTFDVMSDGRAFILDEVAQQLFVQPGRSVIESDGYPRIENVASAIGYKEGISGAVDPAYLADALEIGEQFGSIRFFSRDSDSPLCFVCGGIADMECFGGIAKMRDSFDALPRWFPLPRPAETLAEV